MRMRVFEINGMQIIDFVLLDQQDLHAIFLLRQDLRIAKWMYSKELTWQAHLDFIATLKKDCSRRYFVFKKEEKMLGVGSLSRINLLHQNAFIGIYKNPQYQRVGDMILQALEVIAFEHFGLHALFLEVLEHNHRAIRCYERNAYSMQGRLKEFIKDQQGYKDVFIYGKIKS